MTPAHKRYIFFSIALVIFSLLLVRYLGRVPRRHYCDFRVYHHAALKFLAKDDIYFQDNPTITPFKYSPFFALAVSPLGFLPIKAAAAVFFGINFLATLCLFLFIRKLVVNPPLPQKETFFIYFITAAILFRYILLNWDSGQAVTIMCALVTMSLYCFSRKRTALGALLLAVSVLMKYTPALFIPYLLIRKNIKAALLTILFIALLLLLPAVSVGIHKNVSYLTSWLPSIIHNSLDTLSYYDYMNQSLYSLVLRLTNNSEFNINFIKLGFSSAMRLAHVLALILYVLILVPGRKGKDTRTLDYALLFICVPLFNPNGWVLSFIALAFAYIYLLDYTLRTKMKDSFVIACLMLASILLAFWGRSLVGEALEFTAEVSSFITFGALILFLALCKLKFSRNEKI